jgi:hypothetical protein
MKRPVPGRRASLGSLGAALLGAPVAALGVGSAVARLGPGPEPLRLAWGLHGVIPVWLILACALPLVRSGVVAWAVVGCLCAPLLVARWGMGLP